MARPERNNVDYFPFICEEGNKMFYIEQTYGNDGFATFVKLLRELAKSDYHFLNLSKPSTMMYLSAKCKISTEKLERIICDLVDLGKFHRVLWEENKVVWCQDFIDSIADAYFKRKNKCIDFAGLLILLDSLGVRKLNKSTPSVSDNTQSIVKDSIVKDSIENLGEKKSSKNQIFTLELLDSSQWIETVAMQNKILPEDVKNWIEVFNKKLISELDEKINKQDFASHFSRWLSGEITKSKKQAQNVNSAFDENR